METRNLYLIVGPSGVGKSTAVDKLEAEHGLVSVKSYTDRLPRSPGEPGHVFLSPEEFTRLSNAEPLVAYTEFDGHRYGVTKNMADNASLYVIDPYGVTVLKQKYQRPFYTIGLVVEEAELRRRMNSRGDSEEKISGRINHDKKAFDGFEKNCDILITANGDDVAKKIFEFIEEKEKC